VFWAIRPVRSAYLIYIDCPEGIQKMNEDLIGNQFGSHQEGFSFRVICILPVIFFIPTIILAVVIPGSKIGAAVGIIFHLSRDKNLLFIKKNMDNCNSKSC
jgi:hypothetical protein